MQKNAYFTLFGAIWCNFWVFFVIFKCNILGFKNPARVKEMTNMGYEYFLCQKKLLQNLDIIKHTINQSIGTDKLAEAKLFGID